jgi:hypothetical protein
MPKKKTIKPRLPKKRTPLQEAHREAKERKKQGKRTRQMFSDNLLEELEERSKEDFSLADARTVTGRPLDEGVEANTIRPPKTRRRKLQTAPPWDSPDS